jgi:exonuclease SbcC
MRPLALHIEGFGVFRDPIDIDFDGVEYFALVGRTGAGKSTVIDAICFALYGSVPRYGDERQVARVVSVGKLETKVSLTFAISDRRYRATRVVRIRNGRASTPEAILEELDDNGEERRMLAASARELKPAVERLLGLPFAHFTKCVVLPQGEFARFLHDEPAKRRDLLTRLLDLQIYETVGQLARQRAAAAKQAVEIHQRQQAGLAGATEEARAAAAQRREALLALHKALDAARPDDEARATAIGEAEAAARRAGELATGLETVTVPKPVAHLGETIDAAVIRTRTAAENAADAAAALATLDAQAADLPDRASLERVRDAHDEIAKLDERLAEARSVANAAVRDEERAGALAQQAAENLVDAQDALSELRDRHAAHALRANLVAGEPCPVCEQGVAAVPKRTPLAALGKAEKELADAQRVAGEAQHVVNETARAVADVRARADQLTERRDELTALLDESLAADAVARELERIDQVTAAHATARAREREAREAAQAAQREAEQLDEQLREHWRAHQTERDGFVRAGLEPPALGDDLLGSWTELQTWANSERAAQRKLAVAARKQTERLRHERAAALTGRLDEAARLGVDTTATELAALRDDVLEHGLEARNELQRIEEAIEHARKLDIEIAAAREEHEVADLLGARLRSDRFEKWLLVEAVDALVAAASSMLFALSAGSYSLRSSDEDEFVVVDHRNADEARSVRTLSGGETFQASLALALALSDQLAALSATGGRKLEAIFLDEGFGSLDIDALETVASTIEALGTSGRMVGIVTHMPALAERVPVRYRVTRSDRTARVERDDT